MPDSEIDLRARILLSVQRSLIGEITSQMRFVGVEFSTNCIHVIVWHDGLMGKDVQGDFDAGAITQIVADFAWPERGDPQVSFEFIRCDSPQRPDFRGSLVYVRKENPGDSFIMKNFELLSFASADELARAAASAWLDEIETANRAGKLHCVALSGGRVTQKFFTATVEQGKARGISFGNCHFFWADERCLPPTDPESNFKMANELLFTPLNIAADKIHRLRGEAPLAHAVKIAWAELRRTITLEKDFQPVLDLIFLGMGEDGHVASLFPNAGPEVLDCPYPFLAIENSPKPPPTRISLSYAALAAAAQVWVLVSGESKAEALRETLKTEGKTPLARVICSRKSTKIYADLAGF